MGDRIEIARGRVIEWYGDDPRGIEHGFTVLHPPPDQRDVRLVIDVGGELAPRGRGRRIDLVDHDGVPILAYGNLAAVDAEGTSLACELSAVDQTITIDVDARYARYPITIDPNVWGLRFKFSPPAGLKSVATDGTSIFLTDTGLAWSYVPTGVGFGLDKTLTTSGSSGGDGGAIAVAGTTMMIQAADPSVASPTGGSPTAAYVFDLVPGGWTLSTKLLPVDTHGSGDLFGSSISISGNYVAIGARGLESWTGAAYVFVRSGTTWTQQAKLIASDRAAYDQFGTSISLFGQDLVVGAPGKSSGAGAAYVFRREGTTWTQRAKVVLTDAAANDNLGSSVVMGSNVMLVGAAGKSVGAGAVYAFHRTDFGTTSDTYTQKGKLTLSDSASGDRLGAAMATYDYTLLNVLVGAPGRNVSIGLRQRFSKMSDVSA